MIFVVLLDRKGELKTQGKDKQEGQPPDDKCSQLEQRLIMYSVALKVSLSATTTAIQLQPNERIYLLNYLKKAEEIKY